MRLIFLVPGIPLGLGCFPLFFLGETTGIRVEQGGGAGAQKFESVFLVILLGQMNEQCQDHVSYLGFDHARLDLGIAPGMTYRNILQVRSKQGNVCRTTKASNGNS